VIAREYGFASWAKLRTHVQASRGAAAAVDAFFLAIEQRDTTRAQDVLRAAPQIAHESVHVAAILGMTDEVRRHIALDPAGIHSRVGPAVADALLWACFSPFHGAGSGRAEALVDTVRVLLDAGADPNTVDGRYGVSALYGVTGMNDVPRVARLLLDAGAKANDGESLFHAAAAFHEECLAVLLEYGADPNERGDWGNTPLYFLLRHHDIEREPKVRLGVLWLLDHGADPNVPCTEARETSLHAAVWRGQHPDTVQLLLDRGADVNARRADGRTPWQLARRGGFDRLAALLEQAGARTSALSEVDELIAACGRGDVDKARRLATPAVLGHLEDGDIRVTTDAAAQGRFDVVDACVQAGLPVHVPDESGATALHYAAIHGRAPLVPAFVRRGAHFRGADPSHD
jgi:ankyrin repeat protein